MATMIEVTVPDIGDYSDVPVIELLVAVGDTVEREAPLVTLESDKATMEIPAPAAGVVAKLLVALGDRVSQGFTVAMISAAGDDRGPAESSPASAAPPGVEPQDGGQSRPTASASTAAPPQPSGEHVQPLHASPLARRVARGLGVDLAGVRGSGPKGRIVRADVEALAPDAATATTSGALELAPWPNIDFARYGEIERVPLSRIQKLAGPNLERNWVSIPHVTHHEQADITDLETFRKEINAQHPETKLTMVALAIKAVVGSLQEFPDFNSSLDGDELVRKRYWNVGFAAETPHGLIVPVIHDVDRKGLRQIAAELRELACKARAGRLGATEIQGSTFTISSLGAIGGTGFTPIINAPEVAILGLTHAAIKPLWNGAEFVPRLMLPLSLSYDHRVIDGAAAARFAVHLAGTLSDLRRVLL